MKGAGKVKRYYKKRVSLFFIPSSTKASRNGLHSQRSENVIFLVPWTIREVNVCDSVTHPGFSCVFPAHKKTIQEQQMSSTQLFGLKAWQK